MTSRSEPSHSPEQEEHLEVENVDDDEVFDKSDSGNPENPERAIVELPLGIPGQPDPSQLLSRRRAFSFPFTLNDVRFPITIPVPEDVLQQLPLRNLPSTISRGISADSESESSPSIDIDDSIRKFPPSTYRSRSNSVHMLLNSSKQHTPSTKSNQKIMANLSKLLSSSSRFSIPNSPEVVPDIPDYVSPGRRHRSESECLISERNISQTEQDIAMRLARIGDEFNRSIFSPFLSGA